MNKYYVYAYLEGDTPIYIGAGCGKRDIVHLCPSAKGSNYFHQKLCGMRRDGRRPRLRRLLTNLTFQESRDWECFFIKALGRRDLETGPLYNCTSGGDGTDKRIVSAETRHRMSVAAKAAHTRSETKRRHAEARARPETKRRHLDGLKAACLRPEVKQRQSEAATEINARQEVKQRKIDVARHRPPKGRFKGVYQNRKMWVAQIDHKHLGTFSTQLEAAQAYDNGVDKYWNGVGWKNLVERKI